VEAPFEPVFEAIEAAEAEAIFEAILEGVEAVGEERVVEVGGEPTVEAGSESALEARVDPVMKTPSEALGVKLARSPQPDQEGEAPDTEKQESWKHDRPPLVENSVGAMGF
jgi:hypothetical protein